MTKSIYFTQPELIASTMGGFAALNMMIIQPAGSAANRGFFIALYVIVLAVLVSISIWIGRRRSVLKLNGEIVQHGKRNWCPRELKTIEWYAKRRRVMIRPKSGFGLGMTLLKQSADEDAHQLLEWAEKYGVPVLYK